MSFYRVEPLAEVWEDPTTADKRRSRHTFGAPFTASEKLLRRELEHLDPDRSWDQTNVVVQVACEPRDLRLDGTLRANARPFVHPGVRISFNTSRHGDLSYSSDVCEMWQHNFRSIALGLEALRAVDRFGIARGGRNQYVGFKALPAGRAMPASHMTSIEAHLVLVRVLGRADMSEGQERFRRARAAAHPDRHDGDRTLWDQVEQAGKVLELIT